MDKNENKEQHFVVMTDKFMGGWGHSSHKVNKLIFICDSYEQAKIVEKNAKNRNEMKYINITKNKPKYDLRKYLVQEKTVEDYPNWYKEGHFN